MKINAKQASDILLDNDDFLILTHISPDGDTLGSAFGLMKALKLLNKTACVKCSDEIPPKYEFIMEGNCCDFEPKTIISVDIASPSLLGESLNKFADSIILAIDHHEINTLNAKDIFIRPNAAASCELIYEVITNLGVKINSDIANCLYLGITTDTGCFKYSNVTANTHNVAAHLVECGAQHAQINRVFFDTKTINQVKIECEAYKNLEYYFEDRVALIGISKELVEQTGATESDLDAISTIPRSIEGVEIGVTIKQKDETSHKISIRTNKYINASEICAKLGGGGHIRAAGCLIKEDMQTTKKLVLDVIKPYMSLIEDAN
ncbi:MAG: bifunctional oligoribonuclease/PAP phosphatase NrnA [Oscillospiraceae bacterium]